MSEAALVTVLIPARNEEADIERCLRAVLAQDHPHELMEIVLVDGQSTDRTVEAATHVLEAGDVDWRIVTNSAGTTPSNLNVGLNLASGEFLCRIDARSIVPPEYVRVCTGMLASRPEVVVTGGAQVAIAVDASPRAVGIARALNNRLTMGGARYRSGAASGESDTVYLGCFRTADLHRVGGWDEFFETNQDYALNRRLGEDGTVWFDSRLSVSYVPRPTIRALWKQYHRFGQWKVRYWKQTGDPPRLRQVLPFGGVAVFVLAVLSVTLKRRDHRLLRMVVFCAGSVPALLAVDHLGNGGADEVSFWERAASLAAISAVTTGWMSGVVRETLVPK